MNSIEAARQRVQACQQALDVFVELNRIIRQFARDPLAHCAARDQMRAMVAMGEASLGVIEGRLEAAHADLHTAESGESGPHRFTGCALP